MFTKMLLLDLQTFNILAIRFLIAFVLLCLVFFKKMIHVDKKTLMGGIAIGVIENLSKAYISTQLSDAITFAILIIMLLVKPTGILGKKLNEKV